MTKSMFTLLHKSKYLHANNTGIGFLLSIILLVVLTLLFFLRIASFSTSSVQSEVSLSEQKINSDVSK